MRTVFTHLSCMFADSIGKRSGLGKPPAREIMEGGLRASRAAKTQVTQCYRPTGPLKHRSLSATDQQDH